MLTIQDKSDIQGMIDESMTRNLGVFKKETEHYMGSLVELIRDDIKKVIEICSSRPDREDVREIAREEARYLIREDFNRYIVPNIKEAVRAEVAPLREEIVALRKDVNRHDSEIKALKLKHA